MSHTHFSRHAKRARDLLRRFAPTTWRPLLAGGAAIVAMQLALPSGAEAQRQVEQTIAVTPDSGTLATKARRSGVSASFTVTNTGDSDDEVTFTCARAGSIETCAAPADVAVPAGASVDVQVPFTTGAAGTGSLTLHAISLFQVGVADDGSRLATVVDTFFVSAARTDSNPVQVDVGGSKTVHVRVDSRSTRAAWYHLACTGSGPVGCGNSPSYVNIPRDSFATVTLTLTGTYPGGSGTASLVVTTDSVDGSLVASTAYDVNAVHPNVFSLAAPGGDRLSRGACPVLGAGPESAAQCGDLLYAHPLPGYRTLNRTRAVTLLYSSAAARPTPFVAVNYQTMAGEPRPDTVLVEVWHAGTRIAATYFSPASLDLQVNEVHRLVVPLDAAQLGLTTGAYPVQVKLRRYVNGMWGGAADTATATVLVVNRRLSPLGAGWSIAGVERLYPNQAGANDALLVQGDGSALLFRANTDTTFRSPPGEYSKLVRLSAGGFVRTLKGGRVTLRYDASGLLQTISDNSETPNVATYKWSASALEGAKLDTIIDPVGRKISITYDAAGRATQFSVPGVQPVLLYQTAHAGSVADLDSIADPDGFKIRYAFDTTQHLMSSSRSRGTGLVQYFYHATTATLDSASSPGGFGLGRQFRAWQRWGAPLATTGTAAAPATVALASDAVISVAQTLQSGLTSAVFKVDRFLAPVEASLPTGMTRIDRDTAGQPVFVHTAKNGKIWQNWDANGNLTSTIARVFGGWSNPNVVRYDTTVYKYDPAWHEIDTIIDPLRKVTAMEYDDRGRRTIVTDALGRTTSFAYTTRGQLQQITEPDSVAASAESTPTTYAYDSLFNLETVTKGAAISRYIYDGNGKLTAAVDPEQQETAYTYDAVGRPLTVTREKYQQASAASRLRYRYDDTLRIVSQLGPMGADSAATEYDPAGRVIKHCVRPNWCDVTLYGDGVNPTSFTGRGGTRVVQDFDVAGRPTTKWLYGGAQTPDDTVHFSYSGPDLVEIRNKYGVIDREYDEYGRLIHEQQGIRRWADTWKDSVDSKAFVRADAWHDYDRLGRRATTRLDSGTVSLTTLCQHTPLPPDADPDDDPCRRREALTSTDSLTFAYDDVGNVKTARNTFWQLRRNDGSPNAWSYTYDRRNRLTKLAAPSTGTTLETHWGYNSLDQLVFYTAPAQPATITITPDLVGRAHDVGGGSTDGVYTYDGLGQLTKRQSVVYGTEQFTYDSLGNRLTDNSFTYHFNNLGQLAYKTGGGCTANFTYDNSGNRLTSTGASCLGEPSMTMEYDGAGHMTKETVDPVSPTQPTTSRRFRYDGLGRRIEMSSDTATADDAGLWRYWWLDDDVAVKTWTPLDTALAEDAMYDPDLHRASTDSLQGHGEWFYHAPGVDNLLASWNAHGDPGIRHEFFRDHRGSVTAVTNGAGQNLGKSASSYTAFGAGINAPASASQNPGYNGQETAGGLVYMRNRWYDPNNGQFTQQDPIGFAGGVNLYGYTGNDPVSYSDPYGLNPCLAPGVSTLCVAAAVVSTAVMAAIVTKLASDASATGGRWGGDLVPTAGGRPSNAESDAVQGQGDVHGCMTCGTMNPGTTTGNWIRNHVPPTSVRMPGEQQKLGPHCQNCSNTQGGWLSGQLRRLRDAVTPPEEAPKETPAEEGTKA